MKIVATQLIQSHSTIPAGFKETIMTLFANWLRLRFPSRATVFRSTRRNHWHFCPHPIASMPASRFAILTDRGPTPDRNSGTSNPKSILNESMSHLSKSSFKVKTNRSSSSFIAGVAGS
jgi:hypothetical protein